MRSIRILALLLLALCLAGVATGKTERAKTRLKVKELPEAYQQWLVEVDLLITKDEKRAFLELEKDYQRDAFIGRFWLARDPYPSTARNEFKDRWYERVAEALRVVGDLDEDRSRILLLNGLPDAAIDINCVEIWPASVWLYGRTAALGQRTALLFFQRGGLGPYRLWYPGEGFTSLMRFPNPGAEPAFLLDEILTGCNQEEASALLAAIQMGRQLGTMGYATAISALLTPPQGPSGEWVATFNTYSTDVPDDAGTFSAAVAYEFPARYKSRTVVQALVSVPIAEAASAELGAHHSYNFRLTGEVLRDDKLFDSFRYSFNLPVAPELDPTIPLVFERNLRPGDYTVIVKLEDSNAGTYFTDSRELTVPRVEKLRPLTPRDPELSRLLEEANAAISSGDTTIKIVPPRGELQTGLVRVDTLHTGPDIDEVLFSVDGNQVQKKRSPPFSLELDLGNLPRMRTLTVVALDAVDKEVARDELTLNSGAHRFAIRLVEPRKGGRYERSLRAQAEVSVPKDQAVERVEFYLNDDLVASLYQPPYVQPILLPTAEKLAYVRAVAYQPDGNSTEDLVFVNAPEYLEEVDIQFVELYISVLDKEKRPVTGLAEDNFRILEDGIEQNPTRFDRVTNLPIHAGIMLDISASMEPNLEIAKQAALGFFQQAIQPRDRATLFTFNDHPNLVTKFTSNQQQLAAGLAGLKAERGTALYDSLVFALFYFNGIKGQRALVVLSDGQDEHSEFTFDNTLEYSRRAGVAIYSIGLGLGRKSGDARRKLTRIAEETGGRSFFIEDASELNAIYEAIQLELRSRYYLAYQSTNTAGADTFRSIEVELPRSDLRANTLRGYYP